MSTKISGRADADVYLIVSTGPDVCWTPMGSSMVPVAYNSSARLDPAVRVSGSVGNNEISDFQLNSRAIKTTGHEPGSGRGVIVPGYLEVSLPRVASASVFSEGWAVVRDLDPAWVNRPDPGPIEPSRTKTTRTIPLLFGLKDGHA